MTVEVIKTSSTAAPAATPVRAGGELIKTAAAGTRDTPASPREGTAAMRAVPDSVQADEEPRRSGTAMLLAALALMSGIALRRFGANNQ